MKRIVFALIAIIGAAAAVSASAAKVSVCHRTNGTNAFIPIVVSENAVQTHLDHGDFLFGTVGTPADCDLD